MKHIFIINPKAGTVDKSELILAEIESLFSNLDEEYFTFVTEYPTHATELTRSMCGFFENETIRFYACGGLGTVCEVLNGIVNFDKAELAVYPIGISNDIIEAFPRNKDGFFDLAHLFKAKIKKVDIIKANELYAINHVCFGLDAQVGADMNKTFYRKMGLLHPSLAYMLPAIHNIPKIRTIQHNLFCDDLKCELSFSFGVAMNGIRYGRSFHPRKRTDICDGILNVSLSLVSNAAQFFKNIQSYKEGAENAAIHSYYDVKKFRVKRKDLAPILLNYDGEITKVDEIKIEVIPRILNFVLPEVKRNAD